MFQGAIFFASVSGGEGGYGRLYAEYQLIGPKFKTLIIEFALISQPKIRRMPDLQPICSLSIYEDGMANPNRRRAGNQLHFEQLGKR